MGYKMTPVARAQSLKRKKIRPRFIQSTSTRPSRQLPTLGRTRNRVAGPDLDPVRLLKSNALPFPSPRANFLCSVLPRRRLPQSTQLFCSPAVAFRNLPSFSASRRSNRPTALLFHGDVPSSALLFRRHAEHPPRAPAQEVQAVGAHEVGRQEAVRVTAAVSRCK